MSKVILDAALANEYRNLFNTCVVQNIDPVRKVAERIIKEKNSYTNVMSGMKLEHHADVPWYIVGVIHQLECSGKFTCHLHNGDPLSARTMNVPAGRPVEGNPPFGWAESAIDALSMKKLPKIWNVENTLYFLEGYNGFGYRLYHPEVKTPYLWSFSNHYTMGKYKSDGKYSPTLVSKQVGAAVILKYLETIGELSFEDKNEAKKEIGSIEPKIKLPSLKDFINKWRSGR